MTNNDFKCRIKSVINKGGQGIICLTFDDTIIKSAVDARNIKSVNRERQIIESVGKIDASISPKIISFGEG